VNEDLAPVARELLQLEDCHQKSGLTEEQNLRWQALVSKIFGPSIDIYIRRSYRISLKTSAVVRAQGGLFECAVSQISHLGITVESDVFRFLPMKEPVELVSVLLEGTQLQLDLRCELVWNGSAEGRRKPSGLNVLADNSSEARKNYFDRLYYPAYLGYLKRLSASQPG
jgi:hypothetical protein